MIRKTSTKFIHWVGLMGEWTDEVYSPHIMYNAVIIIMENANVL
jgi:hypothetical protein